MTQKFLSEFVDGGQGCGRDDCQVVIVSGSTTLLYNPPAIDRQGNMIHTNTNTTITTKRCRSCGKQWTEQS